MANPHTIFLAPSNSTVQIINDFVAQILFAKYPTIAKVINAFKSPMKMYKGMTVIITENRYKFYSTYFLMTLLDTKLIS